MKLKITFLALFSCAILFSQSFLEVQLPKPENLNPLFIGSIFKSTIHYGAKPPNYNGKVIVFNYGYIDLNQVQFLFDNSFYQDTYDEGYQAVFVATTRGEGIWVNGKLLAESIDIVTEKFNVPQVYLIGHSNGGKASEAAMVHFGQKDKVTKVFALGTPFWGTYLADISQMPWLNWAWRLTGLNEGAYTSTTYYCRNVVRPYLDNHPNNEPDKFVVLGASGYYNGSNILTAPAFLITGGILLPVQGINDGVSPYKSTLRPGAEYVFEKNDFRAIFDHLDVGLGQFSWKYVKPYIENNELRSSISYEEKENKSNKIESDYYIIHSDNEYDVISLDKNTKYAEAIVYHEKEIATFQQMTADNKILNRKHTKISKKTHISKIALDRNDINTTLKSDSKYIGFIKQNNGIKMSLETLQHDHNPLLEVQIITDTKNKELPQQTKVNGMIVKTSKIDGTPVNSEPEIITFQKRNNNFVFDTKSLENGVYSLFLNAESDHHFKRSIVSGFVVGDIKAELSAMKKTKTSAPVNNTIQIIPNSVKNQATLSLDNYSKTDLFEASIFEITGKKVVTFSLKPAKLPSYDISNEVQQLRRGIYLLKVNDYKTVKFIKE